MKSIALLYRPSGLWKLIFSILILASVSVQAQITNPDPGVHYYLLHSSGNVVAENSEGRAVIQTASGNTDQYVTFVSDNAGYYWIKPTGQQKYMALNGSWNTYFITDSTTDNAKYVIEKVSDVFVRLKCKANGKYLGTDNITDGSSIYSDKNGTDTKHYWYISQQLGETPSDTNTTVINPAAMFDNEFEGWGVSLCWWANMCGNWSDDKIEQIVDWLVSPEGLNYNIFRYNIGGGDDPQNRNCTPHHMANGKGIRAEMEGFKDSSEGEYIWSRDAAQRKIMLKIKEKRPDAIFEAFSNSAPYYMTYSGCVAGNVNASQDNLKPEYYDEFANYLVDVCKFYKDSFDIEFKTLEPFNEPVTNYWGANGGQEGCHFSTAAQINFLKVLAPVLKESGLNTIIAASDETSTAQSVVDFNAYIADGDVLDLVGQWNTHTYSATHQDRANLRALSTQHNKTLWMSEVGSGGSGITGNLSLAQKLMDDIRYIRPEAWVDWQYIEEGNDQWCLVQGDFAAESYKRVRNFYIRQQFSQYIKKGYRFLFVPNDNLLAAMSPDQTEVVLVGINNTDIKRVQKLNLSLIDNLGWGIHATRTSETEVGKNVSDFVMEQNQTMVLTLPAKSITTVIVPILMDEMPDESLKTDVPYLVIGRTSTLNMQAVNGGVSLQNYAPDEEAQIWKLSASGAGYSLANLAGETLTDAGTYLATTSTQIQNGQVFTFEDLGDGCYKIISSLTGKALDMEGGGNSLNTRLGFWDYGTSAVASHRQWIFYPLAKADQPNSVDENYQSTTGVKMYGSDESIIVLQLGIEKSSVLIYNLNGAQVAHQEISQSVMQIPASAGIYLVKHVSESGKVTVSKVKVW